jgi:hypothetical protein
VVAICPTYRRPECLQNALACWRWQDYPGRRRLLILDDGGDFASQTGPDWSLTTCPTRYPSLPAKFNALLSQALSLGATHIFTWEDDDGYLPWHLSQSMRSMAAGRWSHPARAWVADHRGVTISAMQGFGHGGWGYQAWRAAGGYPFVDPGFDLAFGERLSGGSPTWYAYSGKSGPADPTHGSFPSYVYRWGVAGRYHGSAMGEGFYDKVGKAHPRMAAGLPARLLEPKLDRNMLQTTRAIWAQIQDGQRSQRQMVRELDFLDLVQTPSDMQGHVERLRELAAACERVREFGVRTGISTRALLAGRPRHMESCDLIEPPTLRELKAAARRYGVKWTFRLGDSRDLRLKARQLDLLMIDTRHTAEQLRAELRRQADTVKIGGRLVLHDTVTFGGTGEDGGPGLLIAIRELLTGRAATDAKWQSEKKWGDCHGLMVLKRMR